MRKLFLGFAIATGLVAAADSRPGSQDQVVRSSAVSQATGSCHGDCNTDGRVTVDEVLVIVNIILGTTPITSCSGFTNSPDIADILSAVNSALYGCTATPTLTPTPTATAVPTPTPITYRLVEGSKITYSPSPNATPGFTESLEGTFVLTNRRFEPQFVVFDVASLDFRSAHFTVASGSVGSIGSARIAITAPPFLDMHAAVLINGQEVQLAGSAVLECCSSGPPTLHDLEICGAPGRESVSCDAIHNGTAAGYIVTVSATPEG